MHKDILQVKMFGGFEVTRNDAVRLVANSANREAWRLLQILMVFHKAPLTKHVLANHLWPNGIDNPERMLKNLVYRIRQEFAALGVPGASRVVLYTNNRYRLNNDLGWHFDFEQFEVQCTRGFSSALAADKRFMHLRKAVALYRGAFLAGVEEEWVRGYRAHHHTRYIKCVEALLPLLQQREAWREMETTAYAALHHDHYNETLVTAYLLAMVKQGKHTAIQAYFENISTIVEHNLGTSLGEELRTVVQLMPPPVGAPRRLDTLLQELQVLPDTQTALLCDMDVFAKLYRQRQLRGPMSHEPACVGLFTLRQGGGDAFAQARFEQGMSELLQALQLALHPQDVLCRCSSSQFLVLLANTGHNEASHTLGQVQRTVNAKLADNGLRCTYTLRELDTQPGISV